MIGLFFNGVWLQYVFVKVGKYQYLYWLLYIYDFMEVFLQGFKVIVVFFQFNQVVIWECKGFIYNFLKQGGKVFVAGDSIVDWFDVQWEDCLVNNYWWVKDFNNLFVF